jgi:hypothetical protein
MSAPAIPSLQSQAQMGGGNSFVVEEFQTMFGHFLLLGLVLISVYVSRIPRTTLVLFRRMPYQLLGLFGVIFITSQYGWIHGTLAALAFALVVSRALKVSNVYEGMSDIIPVELNTLIVEDGDTVFVPEEHRWFVEKVMGEKPFLIREKEVKTSAVQDMSEKSMGSSTVTK